MRPSDIATVAVEDVAVQVVAVLGRGPLVADHGGEAARLVEALGDLDVLVPDRLLELAVEDDRGHVALRESR